MSDIKNEIGVSAIMGNLAAESNMLPYIVQGDVTPPYTFSREYTAQVDSGAITKSEFVNNGPNGGGMRMLSLLARWP